MTDNLNIPHGGELLELMVGDERRTELLHLSRDWPSWTLTPRQLCDVEMLMSGAFSPLRGFMTRAEHAAVCDTMRLPDGTLWPIPITLDLTEQAAENLSPGSKLALRDVEGVMIGVLHVEDVWEHDREHDASTVYGTTDQSHPGVAHLYQRTNNVSVGGRVEGVNRPAHYDFPALRHTPAELREELVKLGWRNAVAFQTRNPMHRAHFEITLRAAREREANLLIHPVVGMTKPGDLDHYTRVRCYQKLTRHYPKSTAYLSLLPLAMRMAGPREAVWHAIIRKNHGCTHFIVGRDHAGPGNDAKGNPFYGPYAAQELLEAHQAELEIEMVPFQMMVYVEDRATYQPVDEVEPGARTLDISGTELRRRLAQGLDIPEWFTFPEVAEELRRTHPPRAKQGFTVFFTGLSGAGKSTIARALQVKLLEMGGRPVTLLDGDVVRTNLSSELGFSKEHRDLNIKRIGFVASEITKNGGIAICAPIAPYDSVRREVRELIEPLGGFVLCFVATPLEVCEQRDRKGLYAKARAGILKGFTGISDPYEDPEDADLVIDTEAYSPEEAAQKVILHLEREGYIGGR
ncbi:MAG TPA: bifunctional sulfate adenylyltransferase/adenylylsulfate kinase [Thermoanaerobaculia bacterium]|nr:bifunctional sulfate adenylyltransferase/adenylylsulfate kinase [Thermoanaerobaculia bacterium]